ncbi:MAG TPA: preprotein translocase subunit SecE [Gemmataceae bacterium]|jgi:preprotein translocase SecE subunit
MAVAVKTTPEVASAGLLDRMAIASLAGTAFVLGTLAIVFYLVPSLWPTETIVATIARGLLQLALLVGLAVFGVRLLTPKALPGVRAGIFLGVVGFLLILLLTRWGSLWFEYWSFERGWYSSTVGAVLTAILGIGLAVVGVRYFLKPGTEKFLVRLEEQGWFTVKPYKSLQGLRVRRGTIFGILLLVGAGIWTMLSHGTLRKGSPDWRLDIPFTGRVAVESTGDVPADVLARYVPDWETQLQDGTLSVDRYTLLEINKNVDPTTHVKIFEPGSSKFRTNDIVSRSEFNEEKRTIEKEGGTPPKDVPPQPVSGPVTYRSLTLLPALQFTVPLLLLAAALWLAWRIVNWPVFADFLIATEAEMNKVSWTTQRRLVQDTIVVLVTVVLMAFYLFSMDMVWKHVLSWKPIGVLVIPEDQPETTTNMENRPY